MRSSHGCKIVRNSVFEFSTELVCPSFWNTYCRLISTATLKFTIMFTFACPQMWQLALRLRKFGIKWCCRECHTTMPSFSPLTSCQTGVVPIFFPLEKYCSGQLCQFTRMIKSHWYYACTSPTTLCYAIEIRSNIWLLIVSKRTRELKKN